MDILIFKTSVRTKNDVRKLKPHLDKLLPNAKWNFDLEDYDRILRIDSPSDIIEIVTKLLQESGFDCNELTD